LLKSLLREYQEMQEERNKNARNTLRVKVVGCGGGGNNSLRRFHSLGMDGVETIAINTDSQHLYTIDADRKILIGEWLTNGHGAGGNPELGERCAVESRTEIKEAIGRADIVFITAGLGGGTGTGSAPVVAEIAKKARALVVAVVTMPFDYEGQRRKKSALRGLHRLQKLADSIIVLDNNKLLDLVPDLPLDAAFGFLDQLVATIISGLIDAIQKPSLINIDFADIKAVLGSGGVSTILCGEGPANDPAAVVTDTLKNNLLDVDYSGATGAVIHITCDEKLPVEKISTMVKAITSGLSDDANVIFGVRQDPEMGGMVRILTVLTGVRTPYLTGEYAGQERNGGLRKKPVWHSTRDEIRGRSLPAEIYSGSHARGAVEAWK